MSRTRPVFPYPRLRRAAVVAALAAGLALVAAGPAAAHHVAGRPHAPKVRVVASSTSTVTLAWSRVAARFRLLKNGR